MIYWESADANLLKGLDCDEQIYEKISIIIACIICNDGVYAKSFFNSATFTAEGNSRLTINTNGDVAVNEDNYTLNNSATFNIPTGTQITFGVTNASINGGINDYIYSTNNVTGTGGNIYSSGFYWFPDVDSNHGKVETSKTDVDDATDIDTNGGGYITNVSFNGSWQLSDIGNGIPIPTLSAFNSYVLSPSSVGYVPMGCVGGVCSGAYVSSYIGTSYNYNFSANETIENSFSASGSTITETVTAPNTNGGNNTYVFSNS